MLIVDLGIPTQLTIFCSLLVNKLAFWLISLSVLGLHWGSVSAQVSKPARLQTTLMTTVFQRSSETSAFLVAYILTVKALKRFKRDKAFVSKAVNHILSI